MFSTFPLTPWFMELLLWTDHTIHRLAPYLREAAYFFYFISDAPSFAPQSSLTATISILLVSLVTSVHLPGLISVQSTRISKYQRILTCFFLHCFCLTVLLSHFPLLLPHCFLSWLSFGLTLTCLNFYCKPCYWSGTTYRLVLSTYVKPHTSVWCSPWRTLIMMDLMLCITF